MSSKISEKYFEKLFKDGDDLEQFKYKIRHTIQDKGVR